MSRLLTTKLQQGFTLVELLIVVIILAILAAIVVPQFSSSTSDAKVSSLDSTLAGTRAIIDVYYQQHGHYPGSEPSSGGAGCAGGTKGTGADDSTTAFMDQLTRYTSIGGASCTIKDTTYKYGPYFKKDTLPANPVTENNTLVIVTTGALGMTGTDPGAGWRFDNVTGQFIADDVLYDDH